MSRDTRQGGLVWKPAETVRRRRRDRADGGFTLLESLVAAVILLVVIAVSLQAVVVSGRLQAQQARRIRLQERARLALDHVCREAAEAAWFYPAGFALTSPALAVGSDAWAMVRPEFDASGLPVPGRYHAVVVYLRPQPAGIGDCPGAQELVIRRKRQLAWTPVVVNGAVTNLPTHIDEPARVIADAVTPSGWQVGLSGSPSTMASFSLTLALPDARCKLQSGAFRRNRLSP